MLKLVGTIGLFLSIIIIVVAAHIVIVRLYFRSDSKITINPRKERALKLLRSIQSELAAKQDMQIVDYKIHIPIEILRSIAATYSEEISLFAKGKDPLAYLIETDSVIDVTEEGAVLSPHLKWARKVLTASERTVFDDVAFGIAPTLDFDACASRGPQGELLVIMNYGFMSGLDKGMRSMMTFHGNIFDNPIIIHSDFSVVTDHWFESCIRMARQTIKIANPNAVLADDYSELLPRQAQILRLWIPSTQLFVLLHEFAHIVLDHPLTRTKNLDIASEIDLQYELQADAWALEKVFSVGRTKFRGNPIWNDGATCGPVILLFLRQMYNDLFSTRGASDHSLLRRAEHIVQKSQEVQSQSAGLLKDLANLRVIWIENRSQIRQSLGYSP